MVVLTKSPKPQRCKLELIVERNGKVALLVIVAIYRIVYFCVLDASFLTFRTCSCFTKQFRVFVHIPSYVLLPLTAWEEGTIVQETCTVLLPLDINDLEHKVVVFAVPTTEPEPMLVADVEDIPPWSNQQLVGEVSLP